MPHIPNPINITQEQLAAIESPDLTAQQLAASDPLNFTKTDGAFGYTRKFPTFYVYQNKNGIFVVEDQMRGNIFFASFASYEVLTKTLNLFCKQRGY
jgi:hypothetical protein